MDPFDILNEDCWKEVIGYLNGESKKSFYESCTTFQYLLESKKAEWMLELILPLIHNWMELPVKRHISFRGYNRKRSSRWTDLLNCRLVSKSWCSTVDTFMEDWYQEEETFNFEYGYYYPDLPTFHLFPNENGEDFVERFSNHSGNPFFGRCVTFRGHRLLELELVNNNEEQEEDEEEVNENEENQVAPQAAAVVVPPYNVVNGSLLELYGKHIWKVELGAVAYANLRTNFCQNFQRLLSLLPNLKTLQINSLLVGRTGVLNNNNNNEDHYNAQVALIGQFPLPELPCLERIQYYGFEYKMHGLLMDKYCRKLKSLYWSANSFLILIPYFGQMNYLNKLHLKVVRNPDGNLLPPDVDSIIEALRAVQSPLETLYITINPYILNENKPWYMDRLFEAIQHLPVKDVRLDVGRNGILSCENEQYPLPDSYPENQTIKKLFLKCYNNIASFNFLSKMKSLTSFTLHDAGGGWPDTRRRNIEHVPELKRIVDLTKCYSKSKMYLMEVWEKVPSLKKFTYKRGGLNWDRQWNDVDFECNRDEYNQFVEEAAGIE